MLSENNIKGIISIFTIRIVLDYKYWTENVSIFNINIFIKKIIHFK